MITVSSSFEKAKKGLQFEDIFQTSVSAWIKEGFDPKFDVIEDYGIQFKQGVRQSNLLSITEANQSTNIFRVYIDVGVRLVSDEKDDALAQLEASYCIDYLVTDPHLSGDQTALDEFALRNACHHLWPYWREYVMSQCTRMNLPKIPLPFHFVASQPVNDE